MIRRAALKDVKSIHRLIAEQAQSGHILARAMSELYSQVKDFIVSEDDGSGEVVGCGALFFLALALLAALSFLLRLASTLGFWESFNAARLTLGLRNCSPASDLVGGVRVGGLSGCSKV